MTGRATSSLRSRTLPGLGDGLVLLVGAVVFLDTMFFAVVAPLLPTLAHQLHLSTLSAGVLTASYPIGALVGALPGGALAARVGAKRTVLAGLALFALSSVAFGLLHRVAPLDGSRFVQGFSGSCSWAGGLVWLLSAAPVDRRGAVMGRALAAALGGEVLGPVIGVLAQALGRGPVFAGVALAAAIVLAAVARRPAPRPASTAGQGLGHLVLALRSRPLTIAGWLVALPALCSGAVNVLGPLRLHRFGAGSAAVGVTYLIVSAAGATLSPAIGRLSDRRGRLLPLRAGLALVAVLLPIVTLPHRSLPLIAVVVATYLAIGLFWAPAMALLSDAADGATLDQGFAVALMNVAWAAGQIAGASGAGALAKATGDGIPLDAAAILCAVTLAALSWRARGPSA